MKRNRRVGKGRDVISDLHISILHRILSLLPEKDLAKTCVLSKQWNFTRKSLPVLTFNFHEHVQRISEYSDYVDTSLRYFKQHKLSIERIFLRIGLKYSESHPVVDTWLPLALHSGVLDVQFVFSCHRRFIYGSNYHTMPETTFAVNSSLLSNSAKFFRLQKLALHNVKLSENIGRDIFRNCPNLTDLDLCFVSGLKTLNISQPNKLETLSICLEYSESLPAVDTWLPLALHSGVLDVQFDFNHHRRFIDGSNYRTLPETTFAVNSSLASLKFFRLQKLALHHVKLSENIGRDIIRNCPDLTDLDLRYVRGLKTLNISQPNKLETLSISHGREINKVSVDALYLNRFSFELDVSHERAVINLISCSNLRELELSNIVIADFHLYISRFPFLEFLSITFCDTLQRIRISLQRLKRLKLSCCSGIEVIEIDAPILSEFEFVPYSIFPQLVSKDIIHGSMELWYGMDFNDGLINSLRFRKLREDLSSVPFDGITYVPMLGCSRANDKVEFNVEELREAIIPPLVEVDCLAFEEVKIPELSRWPALLEGMIWSCHPKTLKMWPVVPGDPDELNCIKYFCELVLESESMKAAKVESIGGVALNIKSTGGIERKQFRRVWDTLSSIPHPIELVIVLKWDHSAIL